LYIDIAGSAQRSDMHSKQTGSKEWRAAFGPFVLAPSERLLERDGVPVRLGGRALDILIALVEAAGATVGKRELLARVWPNMVVDEGSLRFHIVAIRKALGDSSAERYIVNTANKGYTFVARVERLAASGGVAAGTPGMPAAVAPDGAWRLPALSTAVFGRDKEVVALVAALLQYRLATVVGAGGIGKTTTAIAAARAAYRHVDGDVHFADFSSISTPGLAHATVAAAVGMQQSLDNPQALLDRLAERRCLLVLDCCEHVIDEVAGIAEALVRHCPGVHVLATSREPLRATGEFVYRLQPLGFPPDGEGLSAAAALAYPAVQLFVERAAASGAGFALTDTGAPLVSRLCRELSGIALAIELAAGRVEALGLKEIALHFDPSVTLIWQGRRTAVQRHQTLGATLDWSFNLLSDDEKRLLGRLAVFSGTFSLDAALGICCDGYDRLAAIELVANLVAKSLVTVDAGGAALRYGMLDTTKTYCRAKLRAGGEEAAVAQRLADHFCDWMVDHARADDADPEALALELPNLRMALDWYLRDAPRAAGAMRLAAALCPLLLRSSHVAECSHWARAALACLPAEFAGSPFELTLQGTLGQSLTFSGIGARGNAAQAYRRALAIAERLGDSRATLHLLCQYLVLLHREGRYADALDTARQAQSLLQELDDPEARAVVASLMGVCLHLVGRIDEALQQWQRCLAYTAPRAAELGSGLAFEYHIRALCGMARGAWLTGRHARAFAVAAETIALAKRHGHAVTYSIALIWAGSVYAYAGDTARMTAVADELDRVGKAHALEPYRYTANAIRGQVLLLQGRSAEGVERIRAAVDALRAVGYEMVSSEALISMAGGLCDMGLHAAGLAACDEAEAMIRAGGDLLREPELLVARGRCLAATGRRGEAEQGYRSAMALALGQGAAWCGLRAAVALAGQLREDGGADAARAVLQDFLDAGLDESSDLARARALLA
jgi:predicted ATPase/DNA-binding winged helix-turn-helix (wHTH) protein